MAFVSMEMPEEMISFVMQSGKEEQLKRNIRKREGIEGSDDMIVISDTTPILSLVKAGCLGLLEK